MEKIQFDNSDVISFHNYDQPRGVREADPWLQRYHRPILCTEYMARGNRSTFEGSPAGREEVQCGAYQLGSGRRQNADVSALGLLGEALYGSRARIWFHEVFRTDGEPYRPGEVEFIRRTIGVKSRAAASGRP